MGQELLLNKIPITIIIIIITNVVSVKTQQKHGTIKPFKLILRDLYISRVHTVGYKFVVTGHVGNSVGHKVAVRTGIGYNSIGYNVPYIRRFISEEEQI